MLAYPVPGKETTPLGVLAPFLTLSGRPLINSRYAARINVRVNVVTWSSGPAVCRRSCLRPGCPCTRSDMWTRGRPGGSGQTADQSDPHSHLDRGFSHTGLYRSLNIGPNGNLDANKGSKLRAKLTRLMITLNFYHFIICNHVICEPNLNQKQGLHLVGPGFRD